MEDLLNQIESEVPPIDGLNITIADVRRVIDKAFAARNAFRVQISGLVAESNESSVTDATEIRVQAKHSDIALESTQVSSMKVQVKNMPPLSTLSSSSSQTLTRNESKQETDQESPPQQLSLLHSRANQLTAEMVAFFEDLTSFNKYCINLNHSPKAKTEVEPLQTTIGKSLKKVEVRF